MELSGIDVATFVGFIAVVVAVSLYASRKEDTSEDYFLAGRGLTWWLIGVSLVASNISTEHFVGMGGKGFELGLAIASFEWIAAVALVFVALVLLPRFLRAGIYTLPEYLEYRYDATARAIMAFSLMVLYVVAAMAGVLYTGGLALSSIFGFDLYHAVWGIGLLAGAYTTYGGLKAVVWSDHVASAGWEGAGQTGVVSATLNQRFRGASSASAAAWGGDGFMSRRISNNRSNGEDARRRPVRTRLASLALACLSLPLLAAKSDEPGVVLRASPAASIAPGGGMQRVLLSAQIVGPEVEEYYCPEVVWLLPNGRSAVESDCDPFVERSHYPRFFMRWVRSPPRARNYEVCVELRKADARFDYACTRYLVR